MNSVQLFDAIGHIDDRYIAEAEKNIKLAPSMKTWVRLAAAAACAVAVFVVIAPRLVFQTKGAAPEEQMFSAEAPAESAFDAAEAESAPTYDNASGTDSSEAGKMCTTFEFDGVRYRMLTPDELEKHALSEADTSTLKGEGLGEGVIGETPIKLYSVTDRKDVIILEYPDTSLHFALRGE